MKKAILSVVLYIFTLSSHAAVTATDNPFYSDVEVEHSLFAKGYHQFELLYFTVYVLSDLKRPINFSAY